MWKLRATIAVLVAIPVVWAVLLTYSVVISPEGANGPQLNGPAGSFFRFMEKNVWGGRRDLIR